MSWGPNSLAEKGNGQKKFYICTHTDTSCIHPYRQPPGLWVKGHTGTRGCKKIKEESIFEVKVMLKKKKKLQIYMRGNLVAKSKVITLEVAL